MKFDKDKIICIILIVTVITVNTLIFANSFADVTASTQSSNAVTDVIAPDRDPEDETIELAIRKAAHLIEYAVLGIAVMGLVVYEKRIFKKSFYSISLFYVLAVAVLDEHIQSFSDRTSSTGDILLDFLGALIGFAIVLVIHFIFVKLKKRTYNI